LFVFGLKIREEILHFISLSPSQFRLRFHLEARKKKEKASSRRQCAVLSSIVSYIRSLLYLLKGYINEKRSLKRKKYRKKKRENKRKKRRKKKSTKHDFLLLKYKIIIWTVHFFSSFHLRHYSFIHYTLRVSTIASKILHTDYIDIDDDD
jgi:L-lactate permease